MLPKWFWCTKICFLYLRIEYGGRPQNLSSIQRSVLIEFLKNCKETEVWTVSFRRLETSGNFTSCKHFQSFQNLGNFKVFHFKALKNKKKQRLRILFRGKETFFETVFFTHIILSLMNLSLQFLKHRLANDVASCICAKNQKELNSWKLRKLY